MFSGSGLAQTPCECVAPCHQAAGRYRTRANVKPLVIKLRDAADPVRMSARKYAPPQLKFMRDKIRELEELGLVYKNTGAEWKSPLLILPKPGPDQYRMTVDLRVPNASTKLTTWPMPNLQDELHNQNGSEVFATLDFCQGYWQIPLHKKSQDCQPLITPDGAYSPTRVLHETRDATKLSTVRARRHDEA
jgi:hypothetical protein